MRIRLLAACILILGVSKAQTTYQKHTIKSSQVEIIQPREASPDFNPILLNLEAPSPDGDSYRSFLMRQKRKVREMYPQKAGAPTTQKTTAKQPHVGTGVHIHRLLGNGTQGSIPMGIPNDNTLAVSNDGIVLAATNSILWAWDSNKDSIHFASQFKSLRQVGGGTLNDSHFDPKLIYDEDADRFIMVFLQNNSPDDSRVRVCFSSTNDPEDPWYSYVLPGNPLNNNRWTDFPAISITEEELFLTVNLIIPDVSWQVGFDGSIIWQMDKEKGFAGDSVLTNTLWSDIRHDGKYTRNLHAVWGIESNAPKAFFLSNRNFDLTNDTVFVLQVTGNQYDPSTELKVKAVVTDVPYGMPPNGRQEDTDLTDPTKGLQTNDARVLGAITNGDWIQYVANTVNPATGYSAVYHGIISDPEGNTSIQGHIISHPTRDYGYPNIAWTGNEDCDSETMIGFNFTSPNDYPGVGAIYFGNDGTYSNPVDLRNGDNYTNRHSDSYERWGDYFGLQRKYNDPHTVWLAGYYGDNLNRNQTWVAEVFSPDSAMLNVDVVQTGNALFCTGSIELNASNGIAPYQYSFNGEPYSSNNMIMNLCEGKNTFSVIDSRGCTYQDSIIFNKTIAPNQPAAFPNPFTNTMVVQFALSQGQTLKANIFDMNGRLVANIIDKPASAGLNELIFNLEPLAVGEYILEIEGSAGFKLTEKVIKIGD